MEQNQDSTKNWYAAFTKPRSEETAKYYLENKGIEVFYPRLFLPITKSSGRQIVPLFPSYVFVRLNISADYAQVIWCRGVKRLVSFGGIPSVIDQGIVDFLKQQADAQGLIAAKSNLKVGDEVHIAKGPFRGLIGIIREAADSKSRIRVLMEILNRQVQVEVPVDHVMMDWVGPCLA